MAFISRRATTLLLNASRQVHSRALLYHSQCCFMTVNNNPQQQFQGLHARQAHGRRDIYTTHTSFQMDTSSTASTLDNNVESDVLEREGEPSRNQRRRLTSILKTKSQFLSQFHDMLSRGEVLSNKVAHAFLVSCGVSMVGETSASRNELVTYVWSELEKNGVPLETPLWNSLLSTYIQNSLDFEPFDFLKDMWHKSKCKPNGSTFSLLVQAYAVKGDPVGATKVVEYMMKNGGKMTETIYGYLLQAFGKSGDMAGVDHVLSSMAEKDIQPTHTTYGQLINIHAERGDLGSIESIIREMTENGVHPTSMIYINLLDHLSISGHTDLLGKVLMKIEDIKYLNEEMRTLTQQCVTRGSYEAAVILLENLTPMASKSKDTYYKILERRLFYMLKFTGKDINEYATVSSLIERHLDQDRFSRMQNLIEFLVAEIGPGTAFKFLETLLSENKPITVQMFHPVLVSYAKNKRVNDIVKTYEFLIDNSIPLDWYCFKLVLARLGGPTSDVCQAYLELIKENDKIELPSGFLSNIVKSSDITLNQLSNAISSAPGPDLFSSLKDIENKLLSDFNPVNAVEIVSTLHGKGLHHSKHLVDKIVAHLATSEENRVEEALSFVKGLVQKDIPVGSLAYRVILSVLYRYHMDDEIFTLVVFMKENGIDPDDKSYFLMLKTAARGGNSVAAQFCFEQLLESGKFKKLEKMYSYLILAYTKDANRLHSSMKIVDLYYEMVTKGVKASDHTILAVIRAHLFLGDILGANSALEKHGKVQPDILKLIKNDFMETYLLQNRFTEAKELFEQNKSDSFVTTHQYNKMMVICKSTGDVKKVDELYQEMLEKGLVPSYNTYLRRIETYLAAEKPVPCVSVIEECIASGKKPSGKVCMNVLQLLVEIGDVENVTKIIEFIKEYVPQKELDKALVRVNNKAGNLDNCSEVLPKSVDTDNPEDLDLNSGCDAARTG